MADHKYKTPLLDELEKGPWPSFVKEIKRAAEKRPMAEGLLGLGQDERPVRLYEGGQLVTKQVREWAGEALARLRAA